MFFFGSMKDISQNTKFSKLFSIFCSKKEASFNALQKYKGSS